MAKQLNYFLQSLLRNTTEFQILLAPLLLLAKDHDLSIFQQELWALLVVILAVAMVVRVMRVIGHLPAIFFNSILIVIFIDFLPLSSYWNFWYESVPWLLVVFCLGVLVRRNYFYFISILFLVFNVSTLLLALFPQNNNQVELIINKGNLYRRLNDLPPIVHIVVDEHIGIDGIPTDIPLGEKIKSDLYKLYDDNNFSIHTKSYSRYPNTVLSLSTLFSFQDNFNEGVVKKME